MLQWLILSITKIYRIRKAYPYKKFQNNRFVKTIHEWLEADLYAPRKQRRKADLIICDEWGFISFEKEGAQLLF